MDVPHRVCLPMAGGRGVEPHPISENLVFKASRRTIPAALPPTVYSLAVSASCARAVCSFSNRCATSSEVIQMSRLFSID